MVVHHSQLGAAAVCLQNYFFEFAIELKSRIKLYFGWMALCAPPPTEQKSDGEKMLTIM